MKNHQSIWPKFKTIKAFIFDVDGVLTDGSMLITEDGKLLRSMNVKDGYAMKRAIAAGLPVFIITGGSSIGVALRLEKLGVSEVVLGTNDKLPAFERLANENDLAHEDILYMGDDISDLPCLRAAALACCPYDAVSEVVEESEYISHFPGGKGCVRDVIEKVMRAQNLWS